MTKHAVWGILDQGIQSVINLLIGVLLIRYASKNEYGVYGVGFSLIQLMVGFANAFVMTQMTVNMHSKDVVDRETYCGSMFIALSIFCLFVSSIFYIASSLTFLINYKKLLIVLSLSVPSYILMEFIRRYYYLKQRAINALVVSLFLLLSLSLSLYFVIFYKNIGNDLHFMVFISYAISGFIIAISSVILFIKFPLIKAFIELKKSIVESFKNGLWACGGVFVTAVQNQGWVYLIASLKGVSIVAEANAARLFLSPIGILSTSFNRVFMPKIAELYNEGSRNKAVTLSKKVLIFLLSIVIVYTSLLVLMLDWLVKFFMTAEYQSLELLVILWAGYYLSQAIRSTPSQLLQVFRKFKIITKVNSFTAILWFSVSIWVVKYYSIYGVIVSMAVAEIILAMILWRKINNVRKASEN